MLCDCVLYFFSNLFFFFTTHVINYINLSCIFSGLYEGPQQSVLVLEDLIGKETCLLKNRNSSCKVLPKLIILLFFSFLKQVEIWQKEYVNPGSSLTKPNVNNVSNKYVVDWHLYIKTILYIQTLNLSLWYLQTMKKILP